MPELKVGIIGATGMVGQRFVERLDNHPWFKVEALAASPASAGKTYLQATEGRWQMAGPVPEQIADIKLLGAEADAEEMAERCDIVFSALNMDKGAIKRLEERYAALGAAVVSNNSAHRWTDDVPMIIPEVNPDHASLIDYQRQRRGWELGCIAVKSNCSIQSYVIALQALRNYEPLSVDVVSLQAVSGAGKTLETWPEMVDNINPLIGGEDEKSTREPLKIWGQADGAIVHEATVPQIDATCIRVPLSDGHMARVKVRFNNSPSRGEIIDALNNFDNPVAEMGLPSSPEKLITYFEAEDRPQTRLDRDNGGGMGVSVGRLRQTTAGDWSFVSLAHNTVRGAAGGAILLAEMLAHQGYVKKSK